MSVSWHFGRRQRKKFKQSITVVIPIFSLTLLVWMYSVCQVIVTSRTTPKTWSLVFDEAIHLWSRRHQPAPETPTVTTTVPQLICPGQIVHQNQKVAVNKTKTVLLSAYQEHRTSIRQVRIIAVVLRIERVDYRCHFCCQGQLHTSRGFYKIHYDHFGFAYGTADIMCPIPSECENPSHIAVTSGEDDPEVEKQFFKVKNKKERHKSFRYNFTVCVSAMYDFNNVLQLVQSMEMLKILGVNKVAIYRTSNSPETQHVLDYYTKKGLVDVIPWSFSKFLNVSRHWLPHLGPGDLHYFGQLPALNDCLYRYMYNSRYVALHDVDELILPQAVDSWSEMLPLLERVYGMDQCYMFENNVFPNTFSLPPPTRHTLPQQPLWNKVPGVNILAHLYQEPNTAQIHISNFKILVNPRTVFSTTVHGVLDSQNGCSWVQRSIARMYHTRAPYFPKQPRHRLIYDGRLLGYSERLIAAVNIVLSKSGLLQQDSTQ